MLTFYYHPLSPISRRVWLALLEKEISFESVVIDLPNREHMKPEFLELNPFHHIPVIEDGDFRLIESLAILDYLELKYPQPELVPSAADAIALPRQSITHQSLTRQLATMKMLQMVIVNELMPKISKVIMMTEQPLSKALVDQLHQIMVFLDNHLEERPYFGGTNLNLADIVAGATIPLFQRLGFSLEPYAALGHWCQTITSRPAWQATSPSDDELDAWQQVLRRWIRVSQKRRA